jgi:hypothetical protein
MRKAPIWSPAAHASRIWSVLDFTSAATVRCSALVELAYEVDGNVALVARLLGWPILILGS